MAKRPRGALYVAAIIERHDNQLLIALPAVGPEEARHWRFPRGSAHEYESPEAAIRRVAREDLSIEIEIVVGQPPLEAEIDGVRATLRFFFCGITTGEPARGRYADVRWIPKAHLREYDFDRLSLPVTRWMLEHDR